MAGENYKYARVKDPSKCFTQIILIKYLPLIVALKKTLNVNVEVSSKRTYRMIYDIPLRFIKLLWKYIKFLRKVFKKIFSIS